MSEEQNENICSKEEAESQASKICPPSPEASIGDEVALFIKHIDSLEETFPLSMVSIGKANKKATENIMKFHENNCEYFEEGETKGYRVKQEDWRQLNRLIRQTERAALSYKMVPRSFVVSLISQYDAYLGRLLRAIF